MSADQVDSITEAARLARQALDGVPFAWNPKGAGEVQSAALASIALSLSILAAHVTAAAEQVTR
ncbi:hypothetical protein FF36_05324 [Frankia torreyi]|uniref:Uncharacterized protein n=1 Tax=Frankia torreyi TaxID=1856 RepID=A0A0D8B8D6_9ACTN|nr:MULTISPECIES: hypothetical protein [Frankia]KJE20350.1 hypothetical protein FF36_05324 [Frankia torreyi]KQM02746.1 hypothetical protein FF86_105738 [Frankia sp. CpI1-P]